MRESICRKLDLNIDRVGCSSENIVCGMSVSSDMGPA